MFLKEVKQRFYSKFESLGQSSLDMIYKESLTHAKNFIVQLLQVIEENKTPFTTEYIRSQGFKAMIVETYVESMMLLQATLRNEEINDVVSYIYSNPIKNSPFVTMIQDRVFSSQSNNEMLIKKASQELQILDNEMIERIATAKSYVQRPALLERITTLADKPTSKKKMKI